MMDYSITLSCLRHSENALWGSLSCPEQVSLVVPWGLISAVLKLAGFDIVSEFKTVFFLRVLLLLLAIYLMNLALTSSRWISLACAVLPLGIPYVVEALYYGHQWSNLVFLCGSIWIFADSRKSTGATRLSVCFVLLLSLSLFQNLAHLVSAWLILPLAFVISRVKFGPKESGRRLKHFLVLSVIAYLVPVAIYVARIAFWSPLDLSNLRTFGNGGPLQTVQGMGSWWQDAVFTTSSGHNLRYRHLDLFTAPSRQALRIALLVLVVCSSLFMRQLSASAAASAVRIRVFYCLLIGSLVAFMFSSIGGTRFFFPLWSRFPEILKIFREPWQKFIPLYIILFHALVAFSVLSLLENVQRDVARRLSVAALVVLAMFQAYPSLTAFNPEKPDQIYLQSESVAYWRQLDSDLKRVGAELSRRKRCVHIVSQSMTGIALVELRLWKHLADTPRLRTLSINDALSELGIRPEICRIDKESALLVDMQSNPEKERFLGIAPTFPISQGCKFTDYQTVRLIILCD